MKKVLVWVFVILLILGAGIGGFFFGMKFNKKEKEKEDLPDARITALSTQLKESWDMVKVLENAQDVSIDSQEFDRVNSNSEVLFYDDYDNTFSGMFESVVRTFQDVELKEKTYYNVKYHNTGEVIVHSYVNLYFEINDNKATIWLGETARADSPSMIRLELHDNNLLTIKFNYYNHETFEYMYHEFMLDNEKVISTLTYKVTMKSQDVNLWDYSSSQIASTVVYSCNQNREKYRATLSVSVAEALLNTLRGVNMYSFDRPCDDSLILEI